MSAFRPDDTPDWATDESNNTVPSGGQRASGWTPSQDGASDFMNWWQLLVYQWILFLKAVIHWKETWKFSTADLGAGASAIGTSGWGYAIASAVGATIENPTTAYKRRYAKVGGNSGIGSSRLHSNWLFWSNGSDRLGMEGRALITGFSTSTSYSYEWGIDCGSSAFVHRIVIKKKDGSANWWLHVQDASGTSEVDTTIPCVAGQFYKLRLSIEAGNVYAFIDDSVNPVASVVGSANFPFNEKWRFMFQTQELSNLAMGYLHVEGFDAWFHEVT